MTNKQPFVEFVRGLYMYLNISSRVIEGTNIVTFETSYLCQHKKVSPTIPNMINNVFNLKYTILPYTPQCCCCLPDMIGLVLRYFFPCFYFQARFSQLLLLQCCSYHQYCVDLNMQTFHWSCSMKHNIISKDKS